MPGVWNFPIDRGGTFTDMKTSALTAATLALSLAACNAESDNAAENDNIVENTAEGTLESIENTAEDVGNTVENAAEDIAGEADKASE